MEVNIHLGRNRLGTDDPVHRRTGRKCSGPRCAVFLLRRVLSALILGTSSGWCRSSSAVAATIPRSHDDDLLLFGLCLHNSAGRLCLSTFFARSGSSLRSGSLPGYILRSRSLVVVHPIVLSGFSFCH